MEIVGSMLEIVCVVYTWKEVVVFLFISLNMACMMNYLKFAILISKQEEGSFDGLNWISTSNSFVTDVTLG